MIFNVILILPLLVVINGQSNCSLYNLCGSYGYCYNATNDQWGCECKFWWEGKLCNQQSDSGKQVIILGCLTGCLILTFIGLQIGRLIYKKIKNTKENKIEEISQDPKLATVAIEHVKKSTSLTSCLTAIFIIIVAVATLLIKWSLLRKIHKEIVDQYNENKDEPLYFNSTSVCDILDLEDFNVFTFPFACLLVILCIIVTKRKSSMRTRCYGYGAPPMPIDFLSHSNRKFAAIIFAIIADELLRIVTDVVGGSSSKGQGVLVKFLLRILEVLYMGLRFYPILAAVYIDSIFILTCATLYAWLDYAFTIVSQGMCNPDYYPTYANYISGSTGINNKLTYYGTGSSLIAIQLCTDIPRYLCLAYVSVKLPMMLIKKIYYSRKKNLLNDKTMLISLNRDDNILLRISQPDSVEMLYVKNLFLSPNQRPRSQALFARLIPKFIYEWRDDFRFSARVVCIYSSVFLLLFFVIIAACVQIIPFLHTLQKDIQELLDAMIDTFANSKVLEKSSFPLPNLVRPFLLAVAMTSTITVIQLLVLLVNIRRNLLQAFRGNDSEIPRRQRLNYVSYATGNFHFAGYFIGYFIWGFVIIATFSTIVCGCIDAFVVYGSVRILEIILKAIIPSILLILFKLFLNKLLAQYVFLQHCGDVLALNNRRILMIFIYFNFFLDAFLGFISAILRFVYSIIGGILYMCRLDYSPLGRKLESFDSGFNAYCGFIHTECTHRHPIMLVFVSHLLNQLRNKQNIINQDNSNGLAIQEKDLIQQKKSARHIRKWKLAVFLVRNPAVLFFRKAFLKQLPPESRRALNDLDDNNNEHTIQRAILFYTHGMAAQRPSFVSEIDPTQTMIIKF